MSPYAIFISYSLFSSFAFVKRSERFYKALSFVVVCRNSIDFIFQK